MARNLFIFSHLLCSMFEGLVGGELIKQINKMSHNKSLHPEVLKEY